MSWGTGNRYAAVTSLLMVILAVLLWTPAQAAEHGQMRPSIPLTEEEKGWLALHPRVLVGVMDSWPPINYVDRNRSPHGIGADYLAAMNKRLGGALVAVPGPFMTNVEKVLNGRLDALMDITRRPDREARFTFTRPYIVISHSIVGRKGGDYFATERDLPGRVIALEQGFHNVAYFRKSHPAVRIREYATTSAALDAVSRGEADAYAGNRAVAVYLMEREFFNNLRLMGTLSGPKSVLQFGVRKDQRLLASILDKALASISVDEERAIRQKWLRESAVGLDLTGDESAWLKAHPTIRVALDPDFAPIEYIDANGVPHGISADYLRRIGEILGIRFEIDRGRSWRHLTAAVREHTLDMFSAITRTSERERFLSFSDVYLALPIAIFTRQDALYIGSIDELAGKKVAVLREHVGEQLLKADHPELRLVSVETTAKALRMLSDGDVDAFVGCTMSTEYYLADLGLKNIRMAKETSYRYELSMGVRSDWPELVPILNEALRSIPESERSLIYTKWISLRHEQRLDYALVWKIVGGALLLVGLFASWALILKREVATRKKAEEQLRVNHAHLEELLTERTAYTETLREAKERAEAADHLKSAFLATMSHELRTPLNSIIGFTGVLLQRLGGPLTEEQEKQLLFVKNSANHLLSLITDVLDISKIEAGQLKVHLESFSMKDSVLRVAGSIRPLAEKKGLALSVHVEDDVGVVVADMRRVEQILLNLLANAVKFTERGAIWVRCRREGMTCVTTVADTGIGISEDDMASLFTPFHQVDSGLRRRYEGTGLGLSICKRLAELMGGSISVESRVGEGSVFGFSLPVEGGAPGR